jgi:hypothetical protein
MGTGGIREVLQPAVLGGGNVGIVQQNLARMSGGGRRKSTLPTAKIFGSSPKSVSR